MKRILAFVLGIMMFAGAVTTVSGESADVSVTPGNSVIFGRYEQDNDESNGPEEIEWIVLEVQDGRAKMISRYALDGKPFNTEKEEVTWETCSLRAWLNGEFRDTAFSAEEQELLNTVTVPVDKRTYSGKADPGNETQDEVFLLSAEEAEKYFDSKESRVCYPTEYAKSVIAPSGRTSSYYDDEGRVDWLLRSTGDNNKMCSSVYHIGTVYGHGVMVHAVIAVRPVVVVSVSGLGSEQVKSGEYTDSMAKAAEKDGMRKGIEELLDLWDRVDHNEVGKLEGDPVVTGKLVFYVYNRAGLGYETSLSALLYDMPFYDVPEELLAKSMDEADTIVFITTDGETIGTYAGPEFAAVAVRTYTKVIVMDARRDGVYEAWNAAVNDPPETAEVSGTTLAVRGEFDPEAAIAQVLEMHKSP